MDIFQLPDVLVTPAPTPIPMFWAPLVLAVSALEPIAMFSSPEASAERLPCNALVPIPMLDRADDVPSAFCPAPKPMYIFSRVDDAERNELPPTVRTWLVPRAKYGFTSMTPLLFIENSDDVADAEEDAIWNNSEFVSPRFALIENFANGVDEPTPTLPPEPIQSCDAPPNAPPLLYCTCPDVPDGVPPAPPEIHVPFTA